MIAAGLALLAMAVPSLAVPVQVVPVSDVAPAVAATSCPDVSTVADFDLGQFMGQWHEQVVSPLQRLTIEKDCYCTTANYTLDAASATVTVENTCNKQSPSGVLKTYMGVAKEAPGDDAAKLLVRFSDLSPWGNLWAIDLGSPAYQSYVTLWSCQEILGIRQEQMWVMSRQETLDEATLKTAMLNAQAKTGYDTSVLFHTPQQNCTYPN